jgi:2-polyprenyl-3-methyl-5-hydroxy-6-metoxy-1,4-benzoquinol methylase
MLGAHVTGIDLSPTHIANARMKAAQLNLDIDFHEGDMTALEADLTEFDLVS